VTRRLVIRPLADRDIDDIAAGIAKDNLDAALRFYSSAEVAFARLLEFPDIGAPRAGLVTSSELTGICLWPIIDYPKILIFFRPIENGVEIIRVLHGAQDIERLFRE